MRSVSSRWVRRAIPRLAGLTLVALLGVMPIVGQTSAAPQAKTVQGHIETHLVSVEDGCTSPVGLCTTGKIIGDIQGELTFIASTLTPAPNQGTQPVYFYTGDIIIRTKDGTITAVDAGVFDLVTGGAGDLTTLSPSQGVGKWAGVTGQLRISGACIEGTCSSDYQGTVQFP